MEIWRDVVGYEGLYEVSNKGRVRGKEGRKTVNKFGWERTLSSKIMKMSTGSGYQTLDLWKDGKVKTKKVHVLVAQAFLPNPENKRCVNHKDGNKINNVVENLEWATYSENTLHALDNGLKGGRKKTVLINKVTGEKNEFKSISDAGLFLGRTIQYVGNGIRQRGGIPGYDVIIDGKIYNAKITEAIK